MEKQCEYCGKPIAEFYRSTKKYCNDNCKQLAYYSRQGMNLKMPDPDVEPVGNLPFNVKSGFTINGKPDEIQTTESAEVPVITTPEAFTVKPEAVSVKQELTVKNEVPPKYDWVNSPLIEAIDQHRNSSSAEQMFSWPQHYWTDTKEAFAHWVTLRFRCLLENILRLSNYRAIDGKTIREISRAFDWMTEAYYFKELPYNYPYRGLILELKETFRGLLHYSPGEEITLRLSTERRALLIASKFMIGNYVPKVSFSRLDFSDGRRKEAEEETETDD